MTSEPRGQIPAVPRPVTATGRAEPAAVIGAACGAGAGAAFIPQPVQREPRKA